MNNGLESFLCLVPIGNRFERLKSAIRSYDESVYIEKVNTLEHAMKSLANKTYSVIVISSDLSEAEQRDFISEARRSYGAKDAAIVLIVTAKDTAVMEEQMSIGLLVGVNGFLKEPFSVDAVKDTILLSSSLKADRLEKRQKQAIKMSLGPARRLIDKTAAVRRIYRDRGYKPSEFKRIFHYIAQCLQDNSELYFRVLVGSFIRICRGGTSNFPEYYTGSSPRVKAMLAIKLAEKEDLDRAKEKDDIGDLIL